MKLPMAFVLLSAAARATVVSAFSVRNAAVSVGCSSRSIPGSCHRPSSAAAAAATTLFSGTANPTSPTSTLFGLRTPSRLFSTTEATEESNAKDAVPITLLAGFLGSGKTTALKNLLENREGIKVGVIVNDVAAVNIDAKLIANPGNDGEAPSAEQVDAGTAIETDFGGTVELQNGCACCSLADELLTSVETLMDGRDFDAVVVELSGVADPVAVKQNWDVARMVSFGCLICLDSPLCFVCISYMQVAIAMCNSILSTISHHLSYDISLTQILEQPPRYQIGQREPCGDRR